MGCDSPSLSPLTDTDINSQYLYNHSNEHDGGLKPETQGHLLEKE